MLELRGLDHRLGSRLVLEQVGLRVAAGEVAVIMGPNGAGKTTLLRILAGILPVQSGALYVEGELLANAAALRRWRARIGLLTELPGLYEQLSVHENLSVFGRLHGLSQPECERRIARLCEAFELADRLSDAVAGLSKGLRHRVALVRAVLHQPRVLLLDEPGSGLDPQSAARLHEWIERIRTQGVACILATHDFAEVQRLGGVIHVLNRRLLQLPPTTPRLHLQLGDAARWHAYLRGQGRAVELLAGHEDEVVLDLDQADVPALLHDLVLQGAQVHGVQWRRPEFMARYSEALDRLGSSDETGP